MRARKVARFGILACVVVAAGAALAAPGDLDPAFNGSGKSLSTSLPIPFGGFASAVLVDSGQQIPTAGYTNDPLGRAGFVDRDFLVSRFNSNGTALDLGFGGETTILGTAISDFSDVDVARAMAIDAAGRIVVAGWMRERFVGTDEPLVNEKFALARYTAQGVRDVTFNGSGFKLIDFPSHSKYGYFQGANAVAIDNYGRIVVAGYSWQGHGFLSTKVYADFAVARLLPNGDLDSTFGDGGMLLISFDGFAQVNGIVVDGQDRIILAGSVGDWDHPYDRFGIVRLHNNGALDMSFGSGGKVIEGLGRYTAHATAVALDSAGRIVVGGLAADYINDDGFFFFPDHYEWPSPRWTVVFNQTADFAVARLLSDGSLDPGFGNGGVAFADFANRDDLGNRLAIDRNGRILQVGATLNAGGLLSFAVARYTSGGALDSTFGLGGRITTEFTSGNNDVAMGLAFDAMNRLVVAGFSRPPGTNEPGIALARYDNGDAATIARMTELVGVLTAEGVIDNQGVSQALTSQLSKAQAASDAGNPAAARNLLGAFIRLVEAQRGRHIATSATIRGVTVDPAALLIEQARSLMN